MDYVIIRKIVDDYKSNLYNTFRKLISSTEIYRLGGQNLNIICKNVEISPKVGKDILVEPIPIQNLHDDYDQYASFIFEIFQGKIIQDWEHFLEELFEYLVNIHIDKIINIPNLNKISMKINFEDSTDILEQIKNNHNRIYQFSEYKCKIKTINDVFNEKQEGIDQLDHIKMNKLLRNCIQHSNSIITKNTLKDMGKDKIYLLDENGNSKSYSESDSIKFTLPEINKLKQSIEHICNIWRIA